LADFQSGLTRLHIWSARIHDINDPQTITFTPDGMKYLRELIPQYKENRSSPRL
jgi:hypothetical protein